MREPTTVIIDYGMGNLFSVLQAARHVGMDAHLTTDRDAVLRADIVILPGVGAFEDAMRHLRELEMVTAIREFAASGRPLMGVCLGQQLLMSESHEFGLHEGLDLIRGRVVRFEKPVGERGAMKVPQIGWNSIHAPPGIGWEGTGLAGLSQGEEMYYVHSYYVEPDDPSIVLATSMYGGIRFCASMRSKNIFACQFHPERSGPAGLQIYRNVSVMAKHTGPEVAVEP